MNIKIDRDGNQFVAIDEDTFIDLQESEAGFGDTEEEAIADLKAQLGIDDTSELQTLVDLHNRHSGDNIEWMQINTGFYGLTINGRAMTEGDLHDVVERIKAINRENGYNHLS